MTDFTNVRKFLIPVDSSAHSERALDYYLKNVHRPGDKLGILHVHEPPTFPSNYVVYGPLVHDLSNDWQKEVKERIAKSQETVDKFKKICEDNGVDCSVTVKPAAESPGEAICQTAKEQGSNGIIMGSRGLNFIRRTLLGSVSSYVVNHADIPVTVTKPPSE